MTTYFREEKTCWVCKETSKHTTIGSTNQFGSPDLDLRPPEMQRSTMNTWVQRCPSCGYCAPDLAEGTPEASYLIKGDAYRQQLTNVDFSELANSFLCLSMLQEHSGDPASAGFNALYAAWVCDDTKAENAASCRITAIELLERAGSKAPQFSEAPGSFEAILADMLRRCGHFEKARAVCERGLALQAQETKVVLRFHLDLCQKRDTGCHTIDDALCQQATGE